MASSPRTSRTHTTQPYWKSAAGEFHLDKGFICRGRGLSSCRFLLHYTSRDSVELLGRGKNGVSEARSAIIAYAEASPLYGLIIYRRRKILIKYIPDGTSRLLQGRGSRLTRSELAR